MRLCFLVLMLSIFGHVGGLMQQLASYILAIQGYPSQVSIISQSRKNHIYQDNGVNIHDCEIVYTFNNGVMICQQTEQDELAMTPAYDSICDDFWINYSVIKANEVDITPRQKSFSNLCQQRFWLKMQLNYSTI